MLANVLPHRRACASVRGRGRALVRGFVETLRSAADRAQAPEAPILEEGSEGVRLMTVHKAKGLEFPIVILADMTCGLSRDDAQRYLDATRGLSAIKLAGWRPLDLIENNDREARRDRAEGVRLAVAATRARSARRSRDRRRTIRRRMGESTERCPLSGDLRASIAPARSRHAGVQSKDTLLDRPDGETPGSLTVRPGEYDDRSGIGRDILDDLVGPGSSRPSRRRYARLAARRLDREGCAPRRRRPRSRSLRNLAASSHRPPRARREAVASRHERPPNSFSSRCRILRPAVSASDVEI